MMRSHEVQYIRGNLIDSMIYWHKRWKYPANPAEEKFIEYAKTRFFKWKAIYYELYIGKGM